MKNIIRYKNSLKDKLGRRKTINDDFLDLDNLNFDNYENKEKLKIKYPKD